MPRRAVLLCLLVGSLAGLYPAPRPVRAGSRAVTATIANLLDEARALEEEALKKSGDEEARTALLSRAIAVLGRALALDGHHAEARLALARVLANAELGENSLKRSVHELHRARQDDRSGAFECEIAPLLGIVLSRLSRFQAAVDEYDRALLCLSAQPRAPHHLRQQRATILGNSAEALMALGRLKEAIARYSLAESIDQTDQAALHTLGLAVAYDRDGQAEKGREALQRSLTTDPAMKLFQSDQVFFVPAGDRHYYLGLLHEAFGDREAALQSFRQFLRELPQSRYAPRAREHVEELRRAPGLSAAELLRADVSYGALLFPPERQISLPERGRVRSEDQVEQVVVQRRIELRQCYARALRRNPHVAGELDVALVVDRHGAVALAEAMRVSFGDQKGSADAGQAARELVRCTLDTVRRWRFPPSDAEHDEFGLPVRFEVRR